jgi:hypothetical protein
MKKKTVSSKFDMSSNAKEYIVLLLEAILSILITAIFWRSRGVLKVSEFIIDSIVLLGLMYSITGFCFRFSFFGQYTGKTWKNDLIRLCAMIVSIIFAMIVLIYD